MTKKNAGTNSSQHRILEKKDDTSKDYNHDVLKKLIYFLFIFIL